MILPTTKRQLEKLPWLGGGAEAECFALSDRAVIKVFQNYPGMSAKNVGELARDFAWESQWKAYLAGLAPRPLRKVKVGHRYGLTSCRAEKVWSPQPHGIRALRAGLKKLGLETADLRAKNMGRWQGRLVCIDFGPMSSLPYSKENSKRFGW